MGSTRHVYRQKPVQVITMEKVILTTFTDPMMGLSYESEPIMDRLQREYGDKIEFRNVMGLLVRDVSDFMTPEENSLRPEEGIPLYCKRLAGIYKSEESIGGLPINMEGFCLFDKEHRSSKPLCLAYKAAQLTNPDRVDDFLIGLRHATVIDYLPTTHFEIILKVVRETGIDEESFTRYYQNGSAEKALNEDLAFTRRLGIHLLPAYLMQYKDKALLIQSIEYHDFVDAIDRIIDH